MEATVAESSLPAAPPSPALMALRSDLITVRTRVRFARLIAERLIDCAARSSTGCSRSNTFVGDHTLSPAREDPPHGSCDTSDATYAHTHAPLRRLPHQQHHSDAT